MPQSLPDPTISEASGLSADELRAWQAAAPLFPTSEQGRDSVEALHARVRPYWARGAELLQRLPDRDQRSEQEQQAADTIANALIDSRTRFLRISVETLYRRLTDEYYQFLRAEELVYAAADLYPGLVPSRAEVQADAARMLKQKRGVELYHGLFLSRVLAHPRTGAHLVHAMLRPRPESLERLDHFIRTGQADLGTALLERQGKAAYLYLRNPRFLNAEDDSTTERIETAVDLAILDPSVEVVVLRGSPVDHARYANRRVFSAGINLTRLYHGQISFMFYITRDLGYVNKIYRGLTHPEHHSDEPEDTLEKPFVAAVEAFAIGGGCQLLLVIDRVLAEAGAYFSLPARKEGIIPGAANLRLTRFVGDRLARQGIMYDRQFLAEAPEGRLLCDEVVPQGEMDQAIERVVRSFTTSGVVSAAGNRKALRVGQEPLDQFRAYMATYAREQAFCHFSPALVRNLEESWSAHERSA